MHSLIKIKEVSNKYDITARTLRYYEDMGLLTSTRSDDYAYRMYDESAVKRLEQILILRKLNISIRDIQRIFNDSGAATVLEVLNKKAQNIDNEVALLHELKSIVLDFIKAIEQMNFTDNNDVKQLYDKAREIETQLITVDYIGKPSNINRLIQITDKLDKKNQQVVIVKMPRFKAVSTGYHAASDENKLWDLWNWIEEHEHLLPWGLTPHGLDFVLTKNGHFSMICAIHDHVTEAELTPYEQVEFKGGLYATAISHDSYSTSLTTDKNGIMAWIEGSNFLYDDEREIMGENINDDEEIYKGLNCYQFLKYVPIKLKEKNRCAHKV